MLENSIYFKKVRNILMILYVMDIFALAVLILKFSANLVYIKRVFK